MALKASSIARSAMPRYWRVALACVAIALGSLAWKLTAFADFELRIDQADHARWVQDLRHAEHAWPVGDGAFLGRLASDDGSLLHHLVLAPYNDGGNLLEISSIAVFYLLSFPLGDGFTGFNAASIVVNGLCLLPLALWLHGATARDSALRRSLALVALTVGFCAAHYLFYFSPLGLHNVGLLAWVVALYATRRLAPEGLPPNGSSWAALFAIHATAMYSYKTVPFILVPATLLFIGQAAVPRRRRLRAVATYLAGVFVITLPVSILLLMNPSALAANLAYTTMSWDPLSIVAAVRTGLLHGAQWFADGVTLFSLPGLVIGLAGAVLYYRREPVLLLAIAAHWLAYVLAPGFAEVSLRSYLYVLPLLILGGVLAAARINWSADRRRLIAGAVVGGLMTAHLVLQGYLITHRDAFAARNPAFRSDYLDGQGQLLPEFTQVRTLVTTTPLFFWSYYVRDLFRGTLNAPAGDWYPAIANLLARAEGDGEEFHGYLSLRGVDPSALSEGFLLADEDLSPAQVKQALDTIRQRAGQSSGEVQADLVYTGRGAPGPLPSLKLFKFSTTPAGR